MVRDNQEATQECYLNALRKVAPRALVIKTTMVIENETNMLEKPHLDKQVL